MPSPAEATRHSPSKILEELARTALTVAKKAKRYRVNLSGDNFYANKLATLRADATNTFRSLSSSSAGDSSASAELIETVFAATTESLSRARKIKL